MSATPATTRCFKLTTQEQMTGSLKWLPGEWHIASGMGELCSPAFLHAYPSALCAGFMNPVHAKINWPRLWIAEALGIEKQDAGLKLGFTKLRIVDELLPPVINQEQRIKLALLASLEVCGNPAWRAYAQNYLEGNQLRLAGTVLPTEPQEEQFCRMYAYKAATYENVEYSSAMAMQLAAQYKKISTQALFEEAYGGRYQPIFASGRTREQNAMGS